MRYVAIEVDELNPQNIRKELEWSSPETEVYHIDPNPDYLRLVLNEVIYSPVVTSHPTGHFTPNNVSDFLPSDTYNAHPSIFHTSGDYVDDTKNAYSSLNSSDYEDDSCNAGTSTDKRKTDDNDEQGLASKRQRIA